MQAPDWDWDGASGTSQRPCSGYTQSSGAPAEDIDRMSLVSTQADTDDSVSAGSIRCSTAIPASS